MDIQTMAHRWCNCDFGKNGGFNAAHYSCNTEDFYSYSSIYAHWIDKTPDSKLMVVLHRGGSVTSSQHLRSIKGAIPCDVKVIEINGNNGYGYGYKQVIYGLSWHTKLPKDLLVDLVEYILPFKDSKVVATEGNIYDIARISSDINWLIDNRKECTLKAVNQYIKMCSSKHHLKKLLSIVRKKLEAKDIVDAYLGAGTMQAYEDRLAPQRKAERTRALVAWWNETHNCSKNPCTYQQIKQMPQRQRTTLACLPSPEGWENHDWLWQSRQQKRIAKFVTGIDFDCGNNVFTLGPSYNNVFEYQFWNIYNDGGWWKSSNVEACQFARDMHYTDAFEDPSFSVNEFKSFLDKKQFVKRFRQKCSIISARQQALKLWYYVNSNMAQLDESNDEELAKYNYIQQKYIEWYDDKEAQRIAAEREKERIAAEKKRIEEERRLKYDSYVAQGINGCRQLYYEKLASIGEASPSFGSDFFFGGNVLLRWRSDDVVETSKGILISVESAHKFWKVIKKWHDSPETFSDYLFKTNSGEYRANRYEDDILTAGCHKIAFCEMERMYNEILNKKIS